MYNVTYVHIVHTYLYRSRQLCTWQQVVNSINYTLTYISSVHFFSKFPNENSKMEFFVICNYAITTMRICISQNTSLQHFLNIYKLPHHPFWMAKYIIQTESHIISVHTLSSWLNSPMNSSMKERYAPSQSFSNVHSFFWDHFSREVIAHRVPVLI